MGCISIREKLTNEEQAIMLMESQLEYFKNNCSTIDEIMKKYSNQGMIEKSQWVSFCSSLEIKHLKTSMCPLIEKFYKKFRKHDYYDQKLLNLLGLMLSNGISKHRARLVFEIYDETNSRTVDMSVLTQITDDIAKISIEFLPSLVCNSTNPPVSRKVVMEYSDHLLKNYNDLKDDILASIFNNCQSIACEDFSLIFDNYTNGELLTPHGFRKYVNNLKPFISFNS